MFEQKKQAEMASQQVEEEQVFEPVSIAEEVIEPEVIKVEEIQEEKKDLPAFMKRLFAKK